MGLGWRPMGVLALAFAAALAWAPATAAQSKLLPPLPIPSTPLAAAPAGSALGSSGWTSTATGGAAGRSGAATSAM